MRHFQAASLAEQVAHHLREEIRQGTLTRTVPGVHHLAAELGIHHSTAAATLKIETPTAGGKDFLCVESGGFGTRNKPDWKSSWHVFERK